MQGIWRHKAGPSSEWIQKWQWSCDYPSRRQRESNQYGSSHSMVELGRLALYHIVKMDNGVVRRILHMASAMKAGVATDSEGRRSSNLKATELESPPGKCAKRQDLKTGSTSRWHMKRKDIQQYTADVRPMAIGHVLEMKCKSVYCYTKQDSTDGLWYNLSVIVGWIGGRVCKEWNVRRPTR